MIVAKHGFKKKKGTHTAVLEYLIPLQKLLTRIFTGSAAKQIASSAHDVRKSVAKEGSKKALEVGKRCCCRCGKEVSYKSLKP